MASQMRAADGMRLLFTDEVAELAGVRRESIRQYNAKHGPRRTLPEPVDKVLRDYIKSDGKPVAVWTPVWREDEILAWIAGRARGKDGK